MRQRIRQGVFYFLLVPLILAAADSFSPVPLAKKSVKEILDQYTFVGDFVIKEPTRNVSDELLWSYPFMITKPFFVPETDLTDFTKEFPAASGSGRVTQHLNYGRVLYMEGKYEEATKAWLSAKAKFGKEYKDHRRTDLLIGYGFMKQAAELLKKQHFSWDSKRVRGLLSNAATFLNWALLIKQDVEDPMVEYGMPKGLYNLAAIYFMYERYAGAFGAATEGLNFLRSRGRSEFRVKLQRITAEAFIRNRSYLEAVQELDSAIRLTTDHKEISAMFARVGDIYFSLNNFELAEDIYALATKVDEEMGEFSPEQLIFRGESLFWLGKFTEAQKLFFYGLEGITGQVARTPLSTDNAAYAKLRIADAFLVQKKLDEAKLAYYKVAHEYQNTMASRIANVRRACLELPYYQGNNIGHARELLDEEQKKPGLPFEAMELAFACHVKSYTERERTPEMVERVRAFADKYPESRFLRSFSEPVIAVQRQKIEQYIKNDDVYSTISFFEKNRKILFKTVTADLSVQLFKSYMEAFNAGKAAEFWPAYKKTKDDDFKKILSAAFLAEISEKSVKKWQSENISLAKGLLKHDWTIKPTTQTDRYVARILATKSANIHVPWIFKLSFYWGKTDNDYVCRMSYPILSKLFQGTKQTSNVKNIVGQRLDQILSTHFPKLLKSKDECAGSILDLEAKLNEQDPELLATKYLSRKDWPLNTSYLHLVWSNAETLNQTGKNDTAKKLWLMILDRAPPNSPEAKFAKARMDPNRTEFERIWD